MPVATGELVDRLCLEKLFCGDKSRLVRTTVSESLSVSESISAFIAWPATPPSALNGATFIAETKTDSDAGSDRRISRQVVFRKAFLRG
jgi:hypothetical protein